MPFTSLIDVRPPYYALTGVGLREPGFVHARVRPEHPLGHEVGPLAAAEAGRHLAILGACAASSIRQPVGRHYYLAHRARLVRRQREVTVHSGATFEATAQSATRTGREATALGMLRATGSKDVLYELDVSYKVLSQPAFQRVFAAHRKDLRVAPRDDLCASDARLASLRRNPYQEALPLEITDRAPQGVRASLSVVSAELCAGHFPFYPALPVAVLMHALSTLCGEALRVRWGDAMYYRVMNAEVQAERLAFAGERLLFAASYRQSSADCERYEATATLQDGTPIGRMNLELEPVTRQRGPVRSGAEHSTT
jgi:hypothetical protein